MINSRDLNHLSPVLKIKAEQFLLACRLQDIDVLIYCTYRDIASQEALYKVGRTVKGHILTNKRGGNSAHNHTIDGKLASNAFDAVPMLHGKCDWDNDVMYQKIGLIGENLGLKWAGRWRGSLKERAHFEL